MSGVALGRHPGASIHAEDMRPNPGYPSHPGTSILTQDTHPTLGVQLFQGHLALQVEPGTDGADPTTLHRCF